MPIELATTTIEINQKYKLRKLRPKKEPNKSSTSGGRERRREKRRMIMSNFKNTRTIILALS